EDRPPEQDSGREVTDVLEVEQGLRVLEGGVVDPGQMPDDVRAKPEWERDRRSRQEADARGPGGERSERGRDAEDEQRRCPFRDRDVLEQVRREQVVVRDRRQRRYAGEEDDRYAEPEADDTPPGRREGAGARRIEDDEPRGRHESVGIEAPVRRRNHARYATATAPRRRPRGRSSMVELQPSKLVTWV